MSEPHTFARAILTTIAPGFGSGTGYSRISKPLPTPIQAASLPVSVMRSLLALEDEGVRTGTALQSTAPRRAGARDGPLAPGRRRRVPRERDRLARVPSGRPRAAPAGGGGGPMR